jgi:hypothetical protein
MGSRLRGVNSLRPHPLPTGLAALAALLFAACGPAWAGVTVETRMDVSMMAGAGGGSGTVEIQGLLRRETRHVSFAGASAGPDPSADSDAITRLDKGVQWQLDAADSTYRETPLARLRASFTVPGGGALPGLDPSADPHVTWAVEVTPRTEMARIAGYRARRTDITLTGTAHDPGSDGAMTLRLVTQWWMSTQAAGAAEIEAFERGFEKATGGLSPDVPGLLAGLPGAQDAVARLTTARRGLHGVALRTVLEVRAPGLAAMLGKATGGDAGDRGPSSGAAVDEPLVTSTIEVTAIRAGRIAAARFLPPAGYTRADDAKPEAPHEEHE